ncbi:MAG: hypothetical protein R3244_09210, partial [Thermoanaerobaculia bacterium]|nr:hypothetical protein [Thermoanaerobaculia bacterium]
PIVIDARLDPEFPDELFCDPETAAKVEERWREYFPSGAGADQGATGGVEMGDADHAHLDR